MSAPVPVANASLQTVGVATAIKDYVSRPIVVNSLGEGSTQEGEFLESCAEAVRSQVPVLFLIQDNHLAISTQTRGQTFYSRPDGEADTFYGMPIYRIDGRHVVTAWEQMQQVVLRMREQRVLWLSYSTSNDSQVTPMRTTRQSIEAPTRFVAYAKPVTRFAISSSICCRRE